MTHNIAAKLNKELLKEPLIQEFKAYEDNLSQEFFEKEKKLKILQQELLAQKVHHDENYEETYQQYQKLADEFYHDPYILNYKNLKEEVNDLLIEIQDYINKAL